MVLVYFDSAISIAIGSIEKVESLVQRHLWSVDPYGGADNEQLKQIKSKAGIMNSSLFDSAPRGAVARALSFWSFAILLIAATSVASGQIRGIPITFAKAFNPATIGPGSTTTLRFDIENLSTSPVSGLAFTDNLPAGVTIADPASALSDCGGTLIAPDGGATISLSGGGIAGSQICSIFVNVTSGTVATHTNTSGDLTSSAGNSGTATADLVVTANRPGFSKSFSPSALNIGARSTLTFTLDNSANPNGYGNPTFTDAFPPGIEVADPPNASTNCTGSVFNPSAGATSVSLGIGAPTIIPAGSTCTAIVDVKAAGVGIADNVSGELLTTPAPFGAQVSSGFATDSIEVTAGELVFQKDFIDDPVLPGGTVVLEFSILNTNRSDSATGITFTDDLDAVLAGLVAVDTPVVDPCGGGSILSGTSLLTLSDASLGPGEGCTFSVTLQVPAATAAGAYPNTTSTITADVGGSSIVGAAATETLFVTEAPSLTKTFLTNPVGAGGMTQIEFTITNNSSTSTATDITFEDNISQFLSGATVISGVQSGICGAGSTLFPQLISGDSFLVLTGGNLAAGASCTLTADLQLPAGLAGGPAVNTTGEISATLDGSTQVGNPASDTLNVVAAPTLQKQFTNDPVQPGDTVTLEFTLSHDAAATGDATGITFTDDLDAVLTGLVATGLPAGNVCGAGSQIGGTGMLTLTGAVLAPGASCTIPVTLQVPAGALPGSYSNTTSSVSATVDGVSAIGSFATDQLDVTGLNFTKQFLDSPVIAGDTATLRFTIENTSATSDVTGLFFTDSLTNMLSGATAVAPLPTDPCGAGSSVTGTNFLIFTGGNVAAGTSCTFDVTVQVPPAAADNSYLNATSNLGGSIGGATFSLPPAVASLEVDSNFLLLGKAFIDDPAIPGGTVTLEFTLTNGNASEAVTGITFTDDLDTVLPGLVATGLPTNDVCGAGSQLAGSGLLTLTGGTLPAGGTCTFSVSLQLPAAITGSSFVNTTSSVTGLASGLPVGGGPASDTLVVNNVVFSKSFDGPSTATGNPVLTFTIENLSASSGVSGLSFTDNLGAVLAGLTATGTPTADLCGSGSQLSGTSLLAFVGGSLAPGETCSIAVTLSVPAGAAPGQYVNSTSNLTSNGLLLANPATATLQIEPPPTFSKIFVPNAISVGGTSTLTFSIDNSASAVAANSLAFTDNLPAGLAVAATPSAATTCGGTVSAVAGAGSVTFSGGGAAAGASCTVSVDITGNAEGALVNVSDALTSTSGNSGTATDTIDVISGEFVVTKSFRSEPVLPGGLVDLELSIVNGSAFPLTDIALGDDLDAALAGLVAEGLPLADVCGAGSQVAGTSSLALTGGNLAAGASCTIVIPVRVPPGATAGTFTNTTSTGSGTREGLTVQAEPDSADLVVEPLGFSKSFDPALVPVGGTTTAVFEIINPDPANAVSGLTFADDLEAFVPGMTAANTPIADPCGPGSMVDGASTVTLTGGAVAAGGSCTIQVVLNVPAGTVPGDFTNTTGPLTGSAGGSQTSAAAAGAVLGVQPLPTFAKTFAPDVIVPSELSTLTFVIDNSSSQLDAESLAFDDNLPAGMTVAPNPNVANTCGGTLVAAPGSGVIGLTGGTVTAGAVCQIQVDVTVDTSGTFINVTDDLTSDIGNSGNATALLTVSQAMPVPMLNAAWLTLLTLLLAAFGWHALSAARP